jgi:hypothetical protein
MGGDGVQRRHHIITLLVPVVIVMVTAPDARVVRKAGDSIPESFTEKLHVIPDYFQRDRAFGGFPLGGSMYCGPTAASNAIIQLSQSTQAVLFNQSGNPKKDQHELIRRLGSREFINTGKDGSGPAEVCQGLERYMRDAGIRSPVIKYFGWRQVPARFQAGFPVPVLDSARSVLSRNAAVLVNFGWYTYHTKNSTYIRKGGHWVTLAGYGHNGKTSDSSYIIVHDPETSRRVNDYYKLEPVPGGELGGSVTGLPVNATGFYRFANGHRRYGIIDGFIVIDLPVMSTQSDYANKVR